MLNNLNNFNSEWNENYMDNLIFNNLSLCLLRDMRI